MPERRALPQRRPSETFTIKHGHHVAFTVTVGYYADGEIGEVFVSGHKTGSDLEAVARDGAVLLSIALQHGVPLAILKHAITREQSGAPSTVIGQVIDRLAQ